MTSPEHLTQFKNLLQAELFPALESAIGPLSKQGKRLVSVLGLEPLSRFVKDRRSRTGRRPSSRLRLATAFFAKAIYNLPTTRHLMERLQSDTPLRPLCGWETASQVPTESTFSRALKPHCLRYLFAQADPFRFEIHPNRHFRSVIPTSTSLFAQRALKTVKQSADNAPHRHLMTYAKRYAKSGTGISLGLSTSSAIGAFNQERSCFVERAIDI